MALDFDLTSRTQPASLSGLLSKILFKHRHGGQTRDRSTDIACCFALLSLPSVFSPNSQETETFKGKMAILVPFPASASTSTVKGDLFCLWPRSLEGRECPRKIEALRCHKFSYQKFFIRKEHNGLDLSRPLRGGSGVFLQGKHFSLPLPPWCMRRIRNITVNLSFFEASQISVPHRSTCLICTTRSHTIALTGNYDRALLCKWSYAHEAAFPQGTGVFFASFFSRTVSVGVN